MQLNIRTKSTPCVTEGAHIGIFCVCSLFCNNYVVKCIHTVIWSSLQRFGTMAISFVSNIVLARLLTPDDYGVIGMLMIFMTNVRREN